jgi:hypothetical protein
LSRQAAHTRAHALSKQVCAAQTDSPDARFIDSLSNSRQVNPAVLGD